MSSNIDDILKNLGAAINAASTGIPTTRGIVDTATREQLVVTDAGVQLGSFSADQYTGDLRVTGNIEAANVSATGISNFVNLTVSGKLKADTLEVSKVISDSSLDSYSKAITFTGESPRELDGLGFLWNEGDLTRQFVYKAEPRRIFSTETIDLYKTADYKVDGVTVINKTSLGATIRDSKLKTVGALDSLTVVGNTVLGESLFVNSSNGRVGVMIDQPNAALSVLDNNTEVVLGAFEDGIGFVGSWGSKGFSIITDNTKRITVKGNTTEFGNETSKGAVVKVHGTLQVDSLVADTRIERSGPIEFVGSESDTIYHKGLIWKGQGNNRQFIMMPNPDRIYSSESIDLLINKEFYIDKKSVLNQSTLGNTVINSKLTSVGTLTALAVDNNISLGGSLTIQDKVVTFSNSVAINDGSTSLRLTGSGITAANFEISNGVDTEFSVGSTGSIQLGNKNNTTRNINAYGKLSVNITNPDSDAAFSVEGLVVMNGKRFANGDRTPVQGQWSKGDIVWNNNPQETSSVGWVCTMTGTPGTWKPFGTIGK
jgi:hypothetical protein